MSKKFITTLISVLLLAVLAVVAVLAYLYVRNGQKNFYVQYGDLQVSDTAEDIEIGKGKVSLLYVRQVLGLTEKTSAVKVSEYSVTIERTATFPITDFKRDDEIANTYAIRDFSSAFSLQCYDGYFTVTLPETLTLLQLLTLLYPEDKITDVPETDLWAKDCFRLVVTAKKEKTTVIIGFH